MKKKQRGKFKFSKVARIILTLTLILSMTFGSAIIPSYAKDTYAIKPGDINNDGTVNLIDATMALRAALAIIELTEVQIMVADLTGDGDVTLDDALVILKLALNIPVDYVTPQPPVTESPVESESPLPTQPAALPEVTANPSNIVANGDTIAVKMYNGADTRNSKEGYLIFGEQTDGVEMVNPFVGKPELLKTTRDVTLLDKEALVDGRPVIWSLLGASFEPTDSFPVERDNRIYSEYSPNEVFYARPEWDNGVTISFWAKVRSEFNTDPILTFDNDQFVLVVRMDGSVYFKEGADWNNRFEQTSTTIEPWGTYGEWTHYTITLANDWLQVYVNGQENLYNELNLNRADIINFNNGFLTKYNPGGDVTAEMVLADSRGYLYKMGAWYWNEEYEEYISHDRYGVFWNGRYRGAHAKNFNSILSFIADEETKMWIGGAATDVSPERSKHKFLKDTVAADIKVYMQELTPEQISANYTYLAIEEKPDDLPYADRVTPMDSTLESPIASIRFNNSKDIIALNQDVNNSSLEEVSGVRGKVLELGKIPEGETGKGVEVVNPFSTLEDMRKVSTDDIAEAFRKKGNILDAYVFYAPSPSNYTLIDPDTLVQYTSTSVLNYRVAPFASKEDALETVNMTYAPKITATSNQINEALGRRLLYYAVKNEKLNPFFEYLKADGARWVKAFNYNNETPLTTLSTFANDIRNGSHNIRFGGFAGASSDVLKFGEVSFNALTFNMVSNSAFNIPEDDVNDLMTYTSSAGFIYQEQQGAGDFAVEDTPDEYTYPLPQWDDGLTMSFWVKSDQQNAAEAANLFSFTNGTGALTVLSDGTVYFREAKTNSAPQVLPHGDVSTKADLYRNAYRFEHQTGSASEVKGEWLHVTLSIQNDGIRVYYNGENAEGKPNISFGNHSSGTEFFNLGLGYTLDNWTDTQRVQSILRDTTGEELGAWDSGRNVYRDYLTGFPMSDGKPYTNINQSNDSLGDVDCFDLYANNAKGGKLLTEFLTQSDTKLYIGGDGGYALTGDAGYKDTNDGISIACMDFYRYAMDANDALTAYQNAKSRHNP